MQYKTSVTRTLETLSTESAANIKQILSRIFVLTCLINQWNHICEKRELRVQFVITIKI